MLVLKTTTSQVVDLRRRVELEGIEPSTSSMPSMVRIDQQGCRKGLLEDHSGGYRSLPQFGQLASSAFHPLVACVAVNTAARRHVGRAAHTNTWIIEKVAHSHPLPCLLDCVDPPTSSQSAVTTDALSGAMSWSVMKTTTSQVVDLRRRVELEGVALSA